MRKASWWPSSSVFAALALLVVCADGFTLPRQVGVSGVTIRRRRVTSTTFLSSSFDLDGTDEDGDKQRHQVYWLDDADDDDGYFDDDDDDLLFDDLAFSSDTETSEDSSSSSSLGQAIGQGEVVICLPDVATPDECRTLFAAGLAACEGRGPASRGRNRFSVSDPTAFSNNDVVMSCDEILLRVLDYLDETIPSIYTTLFRPTAEWTERQPLNAQLEQPDVPPDEYLADTCPTLRDLYMMGELEWSEGEPAINVYESNGYFGAHKDHLALTVLIPLTSPHDDFSGGGTGFWAGNRRVDENPSGSPTTVLKPAAGSALIFGGDVTHAGMPVETGYRSVFVCSFSTKTPVSPEDRLHGMQAPPKVSPNFKGTM